MPSLPRTIITALDVGTSTVQTVVAERKKGEENLRILGFGIAPSSGMRRGAVVNPDEVINSIRQSVAEAGRSAGLLVKSVWLAVGGSHVSVTSSRGVVAVSRADGEISPEDVRRAISAAETFVPKNQNKEILHLIARDFKVDHESGIKDPVGMHGVRLEADTLIVECSVNFLKNLLKCVEGAGLAVEDYVFSSFAAAEAILTPRQKELGVMLLDIGGGTTSFIVYEEGVPIHAGVLPIGGNHITNDIAIGFRADVDIAERIKLTYGSSFPVSSPKRENVRLAEFAPGEQAVHSRKELAEIIEARLKDIFELVQKELKRIDRSQLLPGGVVLTGGTAALPELRELTKREVRLPVSMGVIQVPEFADAFDERVALSFATALGTLVWVDKKHGGKDINWRNSFVSLRAAPWFRWLRSFLP